MTRTHRFVGGVVLGYTHLVLVTVVGLWMTPFLLRELGQHTLGLWLIAQQMLGYLLLMDLGVCALLPRETAFATGRAGATTALDLPRIVARARQAVWWQMVPVVAVALVTAFWFPERWAEATGPILVLLASFVALFPFRLYQAFLQGVQELPFLSRVQIGAWVVTTALAIGLVLAGWGLYALVVGWAAGQVCSIAAARYRVRRQYGSVWPPLALRPGWSEVKPYLRQAVWISVAQFAQVLLTGSDLLLVGTTLGATAVVQYACTSKLASVLSNHPQLIMQAATPALSEMRAAGRRDQLLDASSALTLAMLSLSGLVGCVVLALNGSFVHWWVGPTQYGGSTLTMLFAAQLILRHWNITLIYGLFCFGCERRISATNLADGAVSLGVGALLVPLVGPAGAVVGSLVAVTAISIPANLAALARETDATPLRQVRTLWPWLWRFATVAAASTSMSVMWMPQGITAMVAAGLGITFLYAVVIAPVAFGGPLGEYARPRLMAMLPFGWRVRLSAAGF